MRHSSIALLTGALTFAFAQSHADSVVIDGQLQDTLWQHLTPGVLKPATAGVTAQVGGEILAVVTGRYLYLGARLPEPSGRFTARSIGKNPHWEEEDAVSFVIRVANDNDWMLEVGPLGAYSVKWRWTGESDWYTSLPEKYSGFLVTASTGGKEWRVEAAIPLSELGSPGRGAVHISVQRVRAARAGTPEQRWRWPDSQPMVEVPGSPILEGKAQKVVFRPPLIGNTETPIEVGHRSEVPPLDSGWTDEAWRDVPALTLRRNEPQARLPIYPTEVKMLQADHTLAILARCAEPDSVVAKTRERDGAMSQDDRFQAYLATSGSSYVEYTVNALGYVEDASGFSGGPRISRPNVEWNSPVRAAARRTGRVWIARLDVPLDSVATVLGESETPRNWRILLIRSRPARSGEPQESSVLPITQSVFPFCPARYRGLTLVQTDPSQLQGFPAPAPSGNLAFAPTRVFSAEQRAQMDLSGMLDSNIHHRMLKVLQEEKRDWEHVQTLDDWKSFRNPREKALRASMGEFPARQALETRVIKEFHGEGYRRQDLVYQSQPGLWVTANLYLPGESKRRVPGIVIAHSLHAAKTQFELQDMGILWARTGCAVLVMDQIGYGERIEGYPWERESYHSRYITGMQLYLVGESLIKWMVWDLLRGIDLLSDRKDVDPKRITLFGGVAGGGDPAAVAAALDQRVSAVIPFNFGEATPEIPRFIPEKNQWPLELADPGLNDWDTTRCLRRGIIDEFLQWTICAMAAPRRFIYSYELGWNVENLPAWARYKKVFDLYQVRDHLADAHGFGDYPGPGECWNIGPAQRRSLYPTLERWFGIPVPFEAMHSSTRANLAREPGDRRPEAELQVLSQAAASDLRMQTVHELAHEIGQRKVTSTRSALVQMTAEERQAWMSREVAKRLGDIEPNRNAPTVIRWTKKLPNATVEALSITVEPDITVPVLLFLPEKKNAPRSRVVVGVAEGGKDLFLATRSHEIETLLKGGIAVCLPDLRGTGEISPDSRRDPENDENMQAVNEQMLGETLVGRRLKDLRTVLVYLEQRKDLDSKHVAIWGESLVPVNTDHLVMDELPLFQVGPQIEQQGEPLGGLLAVLGALYDTNLRAVVVRGGLATFSSVLDDAFAYVPADITIPSFLGIGDIADVAATLAPTPMLLEDLVDGKNRLISVHQLQAQIEPLFKAYRGSPANLTVRSGQQSSEVPTWLLNHL